MSIVILPTGYGKTKVANASIIPNLVPDSYSSKGPTLMIYPTISLIDDQRNAWQKDFVNEIKKYNKYNPQDLIREPNVLFLTSDYKKKFEINYASIFSKLLDGDLDVLCCSPEALFHIENGISLLDIIPQMKTPFSNLIIDEVHTIFDWGDSIRDDYLRLPFVEKLLRWTNPNLHTILMTATLTPMNESRLISLFDFEEIITSEQRIRHDEIRPDLAFTIIELEEPLFQAPKLIQTQANKIPWNSAKYSIFGIPPFLIYTNRQDNCEIIKNMISSSNGDVYHGGLPGNKKSKLLRKFMSNELDFLACTSAFGMGVDKKDIWLTSHIGLPYTVQEMYQMFGRTARDSGWLTGGQFKNGNCLAFLPLNPKFQAYKPSAGAIKLFERLYWSLVEGYSIPGFYLFSLSSREYSFWEPNAGLGSIESIYSISDSDEINSEYDFLTKEQLEILRKEHQKNGAIRISKDRAKKMASSMRIDKERQIAITALRILEQSEYIKILGIHPLIPVNDSENSRLIELLQINGYDSVLDRLTKVGINGASLNTDRQRYVVAEVKKPISSIADYLEALEEGITLNSDHYNYDQDQLKTFINSNDCIRKRFALAIGSSNIQSCLETYENNFRSPLSEFNPPVAPCSVCRESEDKAILSDVENGLSFDSKNPSIWLSKDKIEYLSGRKNEIIIEKEEIFGIIKNLPIKNFVIEYPFSTSHVTAEVNTMFIQKIIENFGYDILIKSGKKYTLPFSTKRNGEIIEHEIVLENFIGRLESDYMIPKQSLKFPKLYDYGALCYKKNSKLFVRYFSSKESKKVWWTLYKKNDHKLIGSYPHQKHHFLAGPPPNTDGEGSKIWRSS